MKQGRFSINNNKFSEDLVYCSSHMDDFYVILWCSYVFFFIQNNNSDSQESVLLLVKTKQ